MYGKQVINQAYNVRLLWSQLSNLEVSIDARTPSMRYLIEGVLVLMQYLATLSKGNKSVSQRFNELLRGV